MTISRAISPSRNPYFSNKVADCGFTVGVEGANAINTLLQLKDRNGRDVSERCRVRAWLSSDTPGDTLIPAHLMPSGGLVIGTDGTMFKGALHDTALVQKSTLLIDAVPEKFKTTTTAYYRVNGATFSKAAATAIVFTAAHVITASKFAVILIQVTAAGVVSTKVPVTPQAYNSAALALAALPAPDAGNVALGYIAIANKAATWTANTDDLTNASDVTTAAFVDAPENGQFAPTFELLSEADGDIDVTITETGIRTYYLNVQMPDGSVKTSGAITFA